MLPNMSALKFNTSCGTEEDKCDDYTWFMPYYRVIGQIELPPKKTPNSKSLVMYKMVGCPYCPDVLHVKATNFDSQLGKRVRDHLDTCKGYHWHVQGLRRSRKRSENRKPFQAKSASQLIINKHGKLESHELGSLIRCCAHGLERGCHGAAQRTAHVPITKARLESGDFWTGGWIPNVGE